MHHHTLTELSAALHAKKISSTELTQHFLTRIDHYDKTFNSFIRVTHASALEQAQQADLCYHKGRAGPLTGIPIAHKDIFCTKGIETSCASKMLAYFIPPYDATLVHALKQAGTVLLGKTNMDEFAMGSSNENSFYGSVKNPWDISRVPGGSSGGSSAAVAARLTPAATGTDTGGSIRQPAALCNLTGLKPTYGRVSRYGLIAFASSLDQAGPMTHTAEDAALLMNVMAGFDEKDSTSIDCPVPDYRLTLNDSLDGLRIGLPKEYFSDALDPSVATTIETAIKCYEQLGAKISAVSLPNCPLVIPPYYIIASAECSSNLARYDGVRYGYRCNNPVDLNDLYERTRGEGFGNEVKRRLLMGTYVLSADSYDAYYVKAQKIRALLIQEFEDAFQNVDILLGPTTPTTAFKLGEKTNDPVSMYLSDIYTIAVNLAGLPAISIPAGFIDNLPLGMQLIGRPFSEAKLLNVAHRYQQETNWHKKTPENYTR
ncbi:Asp-tRNA(Asn)/Glu-tRNA(Gln) amidotransferase subunit GatA [Rickettsiella grylli]|nr:Asp-tRNA(Asn)/Glu-tRNA(Gln) amidotransferase subunit GatA [Rickettsiella grylli]